MLGIGATVQVPGYKSSVLWCTNCSELELEEAEIELFGQLSILYPNLMEVSNLTFLWRQCHSDC